MVLIHPYGKCQAANSREKYTHSGSIILKAALAVGSTGVVVVVGPFWNGAINGTVKDGVVDMIGETGVMWDVSVFSAASPSSILKRVESPRMEAMLTDGDGDSIFRLFFDGRDEPSFSSDLRIRCIHEP